jgi:uncharacterized RDD family membrane protein YckC
MVVHEVITTERVPFHYQVAGIGSRFLAWLVDVAIMAVLIGIGFFVGMALESARGGLLLAVFWIWMFVVQWGYFILFEWLWLGQTPGKRMLGLRVIQSDGTSISFAQSAIRNILRVADGLPLVYGLGFIVALCNREQRRLGDLAAGTLVVHVDRKRGPIRAIHHGRQALSQAELADMRQRLTTLSPEQRQALLDLCLRREQLGVSDRARLFQTVARHVGERYGLARAETQSDEKFVLLLVEALGEAASAPFSPGATGKSAERSVLHAAKSRGAI